MYNHIINDSTIYIILEREEGLNIEQQEKGLCLNQWCTTKWRIDCFGSEFQEKNREECDILLKNFPSPYCV